MVQDVQFAVTLAPRGSDQLLRITGELDVATVPVLRSAVDDVLSDSPALLLLDLTGALFIDSTGCRELVHAAKAGRAAGVPVEVVVPPDNWKVRRVVDFVHLSSLVPVHDELPPPVIP